jgi:hypothetical protein
MFIHQIADGFLLLRACYYSLIHWLPSNRETSQEQLPLWEPQVLSALRGAQVTHYINANSPVPLKEIPKSAEKPTELISNPDYEAWVAKDQ